MKKKYQKKKFEEKITSPTDEQREELYPTSLELYPSKKRMRCNN